MEPEIREASGTAEPDCKWCGQSRAEHVLGFVNHAYERPDSQRRARMPTPSLRVSGLPGDPVLRQVLVDKGIITAADLRRAERRLRATADIRPEV